MTDLEAYEQWRDSKIAEGDSDVNPFMIWNAALRFARKAAWIPISERLPEKDVDVLFFLDDPRSDVGLGCWTGRWTSARAAIVMDYGDEDGDWLPCSHWMPLPEPPTTVAEQT